jgi:hypothetical protein
LPDEREAPRQHICQFVCSSRKAHSRKGNEDASPRHEPNDTRDGASDASYLRMPLDRRGALADSIVSNEKRQRHALNCAIASRGERHCVWSLGGKPCFSRRPGSQAAKKPAAQWWRYYVRMRLGDLAMAARDPLAVDPTSHFLRASERDHSVCPFSLCRAQVGRRHQIPSREPYLDHCHHAMAAWLRSSSLLERNFEGFGPGLEHQTPHPD